MSGVVVVLALMRASAPLVVAVPEAKMIGDVLPIGLGPPAIGAVTISAVDDRPLRRGAARHVTERVQVTLITNDATQRLQIMRLIKSAVADKIAANLGGVTRVAVLADGRGPDFMTDSGLHAGSQDFMVSYLEAA